MVGVLRAARLGFTHRTLLSSLWAFVVRPEPDTTRLLSLLMATLSTEAVWPSSVVRQSPEPRSHTLRGSTRERLGVGSTQQHPVGEQTTHNPMTHKPMTHKLMTPKPMTHRPMTHKPMTHRPE